MLRTRCVLLLLAALLALGATQVQAAPSLKVPWPCGVSYRITQGHNGGSHTGFGAWAWDIGIPVGGEVVAPADGVIRRVRMDSTTGGCSSSYANDANYVVIDFGDGSEALLLHLEAFSTSLQAGDSVKQGDVVGRVGLTGWVCGAHLHFQVQQTCSSWWCQSVAASFETFGDPAYDSTIESDNCGGPAPVCEVRLSGGSHVVDEQDAACFERFTSHWWSVSEGEGGHHWYTFATDAAQVETWGRWRFDVDVAGAYRVEVFVPNTEADSRAAIYQIDTGAGTATAGPIDQSSQKGWVELGVFDFAAGAGRSIVLGDNTGENYDQLMRKLAYDAVRLSRVEAPPPPDDTIAGEDTASGVDTHTVGSDGVIGPAPDAPTRDVSTASGDTDALDAGGGQDLSERTSGACACSSVQGGGDDQPAPLWPMLLALTFGVCLRRRASGSPWRR